ncbi:hypothetical protein HIM_01710 [Hirsutella minnesotensis 3608]|nr:hypothetical protein HIM_01710 [Hirsutella minnesotensis 3608]
MSAQVRVPWHKLRAWIDEHVALEQEHNRPAQLSTVQLEALSLLIDLDDGEPDLGQRDYVSLLLNETQRRRLTAPVFTDRDPISVPVQGKSQLKWRYVCSLTGHGSFPRPEWGIEAGQQEPSFQSKRNAKRYAAKCALQYLQERLAKPAAAAFPSTTRDIIAPIGPPPSKRKTAATSPSPVPQSRVSEAHRVQYPPPQSQPHASAAAGSESSSSSPGSDESQSVFQRVTSLAISLGFTSPQYHVQPEGDLSNFFSGRATFSPGDLVPSGVGVVSGVLGKKQARLQSAEQVLEWLEGEARRRAKIFENMFSQQR